MALDIVFMNNVIIVVAHPKMMSGQIKLVEIYA